MYRIDDTTSAIKEVQRLLGIKESGRYDYSTRDAVSGVQRIYSLPDTGVINYKTFIALVDTYRRRKTSVAEPSFLFNPVFPIIKGDMGINSGRINDALSIILQSYSYEEAFPRGKYIGDDTMNGVKFLQGIFGMDLKDEIDAGFINRISLELNGIRIKEEFGIKP